jgi:hypothetical protein
MTQKEDKVGLPKTSRIWRNEKMAEKKLTAKKILDKSVLILLLVLIATVVFWGTFFVTVIVINTVRIYGLASSCVPPIFSAFIAALVVMYVVMESREMRKCPEEVTDPKNTKNKS